MDRCGNSGENVGEEKESVERRSAKRKIKGRQGKKKEYQSGRQGRKVARHSCFTVFCGSGRSKSRLAKAAGAEPSCRMRDQKLHAAVARSTFQSQNDKSITFSEHFWKLRVAVVRNAFWSQNDKTHLKTSAPKHFWKLSARGCRVKHIWKSKCYVRITFGRSTVIFCGRHNGFCTIPT